MTNAIVSDLAGADDSGAAELVEGAGVELPQAASTTLAAPAITSPRTAELEVRNPSMGMVLSD
jgi:hypothetical protein